MKTWVARKETVQREWVLFDATNKTVGRLATEVACVLRGKNKAIFTPHTDTGDFVVVVNTDKLRFTGNKINKKTYYWHTGFIGGLKERMAKDVMENKSDVVFKKAVQGMLPKNKLNRKIIKKLKIYRGAEHNHASQKPRAIS